MTEEKRKEFNLIMDAVEDWFWQKYYEADDALKLRSLQKEWDIFEDKETLNEEIKKWNEDIRKQNDEAKKHNEFISIPRNREQILEEYIKTLPPQLIEQAFEMCSDTDFDELVRVYYVFGLIHYFISDLCLRVFKRPTPEYEEAIIQTVYWHKKASAVATCKSKYRFWAIQELAVLLEKDRWRPTRKDRNELESLFETIPQHSYCWSALGRVYERLNDLIKAKECYEKAKHGGIDCQSELEAVDLALGVDNAKSNAMQRFVQKIVFCSNLTDSVTRKLKNLFGSDWNKLQKSTKECLTTGFLTYILLYKNFYAEGQTDMDYSSVIIPVMKALEIEFSRIFFECFLTWLKANDIPPSRFDPEKCEFVEYCVKPEDYEYVETKQGYDYYRLKETDKQIQYVASEKKGVFGIGKLKYWVLDFNQDPFNRSPSVNPVFVDFFNEIFLPEAFETASRKTMIESYLLELTQKLSYLAGRVRNPAAHNDTMPFWKANYCCNVVVMVDRVLQNFIAKIKPEYVRSGKGMPKSSETAQDWTF